MVKAYRAYKRAYKKAYKRGNALLSEKTVNQRHKVELFKRKMKLRMYLFVGKGVINWGVKMFRKYDLNWLVSIKKKK